MQPARPSFLEYFEQKEKENQINSFGKSVPGPLKNSSDWKVPQDGDYEFVSRLGSRWSCLRGKVVWNITHPILSFHWKCKVLEHIIVQLTAPLNAPGGSSWAKSLRSLRQHFDWRLSCSKGPQLISGIFFDLVIIYSLAIFPFIEFEFVNGKRNI